MEIQVYFYGRLNDWSFKPAETHRKPCPQRSGWRWRPRWGQASRRVSDGGGGQRGSPRPRLPSHHPERWTAAPAGYQIPRNVNCSQLSVSNPHIWNLFWWSPNKWLDTKQRPDIHHWVKPVRIQEKFAVHDVNRPILTCRLDAPFF